jgi:hypothetical protein
MTPPSSSMESTHPGHWKVYLLSAAVSAATTALLTFVLQAAFPQVQKVMLITSDQGEAVPIPTPKPTSNSQAHDVLTPQGSTVSANPPNPAGTGSVGARIFLKGLPSSTSSVTQPPSRSPEVVYPLLIFQKKLSHVQEGRQADILHWMKSPPIWVYQISIGNLSSKTLKDVEVDVDFSGEVTEEFGEVGGFAIASVKGVLQIGTQKLLPSDTKWHSLSSKGRPFVLSVPFLLAGDSNTLIFGVSSHDRPPLGSIIVTVHCSEGKFEEVTPARWDSIVEQNNARIRDRGILNP